MVFGSSPFSKKPICIFGKKIYFCFYPTFPRNFLTSSGLLLFDKFFPTFWVKIYSNAKESTKKFQNQREIIDLLIKPKFNLKIYIKVKPKDFGQSLHTKKRSKINKWLLAVKLQQKSAEKVNITWFHELLNWTWIFHDDLKFFLLFCYSFPPKVSPSLQSKKGVSCTRL